MDVSSPLRLLKVSFALRSVGECDRNRPRMLAMGGIIDHQLQVCETRGGGIPVGT